MRAIISLSGSFKAIFAMLLPTRLDQAGDQPAGAEVAKGDAAHLQLAVVTFGPAGDLATVVYARRRRVARQFGELQRCGKPLFHGLCLVARDGPELRAASRKLFGQSLATVVLLY